jgi:GT2 family glycosyltransferase
MEAASEPFVASFDDDSYPVDRDYFARVTNAFERYPNAGVIAATIDYREDERSPAQPESTRVSSFVGCGCAYRRHAWQTIEGYVPLPLAYGMEEVDVSLQFLDEGWTIVHDRRLRIYHDTDRGHHERPEVTAASIANRALLAYLRYPLRYWPLGLLQVVNRVVWSVRAGRVNGIADGIGQIPSLIQRHREYRNPVAGDTVSRFRALRGTG